MNMFRKEVCGGFGAAIFLLTFWALSALPQTGIAVQRPAAQAGNVVERAVYDYPSWEKAVEATDVEKYATAEEYGAATRDSRYILEKLRYYSDSLAVVAYLYRPVKSEEAKRPLIVFNRGSYVRPDIAPELLSMFHRLADGGFVVLAPMYRGSDGGEGHDEMGGADLNDLMNVIPLLKRLDMVDTQNVFLYGESRGGMMVFQAIRDGFAARAAATFGAFSDLSEITSTNQGKATAKAIWPDFDERQAVIIPRRSAIRWPEKLGLPLLLMHGSEDRAVPPAQTLRLALELSKSQKEFGVIVFPGGNHTIRQYQLERDRQAVEFFRRHILK